MQSRSMALVLTRWGDRHEALVTAFRAVMVVTPGATLVRRQHSRRTASVA